MKQKSEAAPVNWGGRVRSVARRASELAGFAVKRNQNGTCDATWLVPDESLVHLKACPCCCAEENSLGAEHGLQKLITELRKLSAEGRLTIWDLRSRQCIAGEAITSICANGSCIQIGLAEDWPIDR